jgi:O-antigen/teichoic acid export membrane protein
MIKLSRFASLGFRSSAGSGIQKLLGFGSSTLLLAAAGLVVIPAMMAASGATAWGAIAAGQSVGAIAAVMVLGGWGWSGPARVARATAAERRAEYLESVYARVVLAIPASLVSAGIAYLIAPSSPLFAATGAVSMALMGLTAQWYYAGLSRPFPFLILETLPRVAGVALGIALMRMGRSAIAGPLGIVAGIILGLICSTFWILWDTRHENPEFSRPRRLAEILALNRYGMMAGTGSAVWSATPQAIVAVLAPPIQPMFALVYKLYRQAIAGSVPAIVVLQGWVPRGTDSARFRRASIALVIAGCFALAVGIVTFILAPYLLAWLGDGQISVPWLVMLLMSICVSVALFELILSQSVLAAFGLVQVCVKAIAVGGAVGLPLVVLGAIWHSVESVLGGVLMALLVTMAIEFAEYTRATEAARMFEG